MLRKEGAREIMWHKSVDSLKTMYSNNHDSLLDTLRKLTNEIVQVNANFSDTSKYVYHNMILPTSIRSKKNTGRISILEEKVDKNSKTMEQHGLK